MTAPSPSFACIWRDATTPRRVRRAGAGRHQPQGEHQLVLVHGAQLHSGVDLGAVSEQQVPLPLGGQLDVAVRFLIQQAEALFRRRAGVVHPDDEIHPAALAHVQQTRLVRLGGDLHRAVAVQVPADEVRHVPQRSAVQFARADLVGGDHLLALLVEPKQHRGQIVAGDTGPAVQHQIVFAVGPKARRHRGAAGEFIRRKAHDRDLLEAAIPVHGQQLDLHPAVLQRGHQDQVLIAAAGDVLHQILLIGLLQNRADLPVFVGVNGQITVPLCGEVTHHHLHGAAVLQLGQPNIIHRVRKALDALAHLPPVLRVPLQKGDADVGGLGGGVKDRRILLPVAVEVL